jgi:glyoxylase-like metal-dependent hydrolase (beta-lactamase superfamily II)
MSVMETLKVRADEARLTRKVLFALLAAVALGGACAAEKLSDHPVGPADIGIPTSTSAMLAALEKPGAATFEAVVSADWRMPYASQWADIYELAKVKPFDQRWLSYMVDAQVYFYAVRYPTRGLILIDAGLPSEIAPLMDDRLRALLSANGGGVTMRQSTGAWLNLHGEAPAAVFLTHLHYDHTLGLLEVPAATPVYAGAGDRKQADPLSGLAAKIQAAPFRGRGPIREWPVDPDPDGRLAGVVDVFGDGSIFAIRAPGHTPGSTAYLVNAMDGVHLVTGDAVHTVLGWKGDMIEHNADERDFDLAQRSRQQLKALEAAIPGLHIHLGHQNLYGPNVEEKIEAARRTHPHLATARPADLGRKRVVVGLPAQTLETFAGRYRNDASPTVELVLAVKNRKLFVLYGGGRLQMFPESAEQVFSKQMDLQLSFIRSDNSAVVGMIQHQYPIEQRWTKVE